MKKLILTLTVFLGISLSINAQTMGGGLFERGAVSDEEFYGAGGFRDGPLMPNIPGHNKDTNQDAPLTGGLLLLAGLGAAYALKKKNED